MNLGNGHACHRQSSIGLRSLNVFRYILFKPNYMFQKLDCTSIELFSQKLKSPYLCVVSNSSDLITILTFNVGETRQDGERTGFEVVTVDGRSGSLASSISRQAIQLI